MARKMNPEAIRCELAALLEGLASSDDLVHTYQCIGGCYLRLGELDAAEEWCRRALSLGPMDPWSHLYFGNLACARQQHQSALECYMRAAELLPEEAVCFWCIADAYEAMSQHVSAGEFYRRACRVDPLCEEAKTKLKAWQEKQSQRQVREAVSQACDNGHAATTVLLARRWLADHPNDTAVISLLSDMLSQMNRYDEAKHVIQDTIERFDGDDAQHLFLTKMGCLCRYHGDFAEAERWFRKAVDADPDDSGSYTFLGAVQARQGKLKNAEESHRKATKCGKGCIDEAFHNLGLVLRGQGRLAESADCFRRAIAIDAGYENATEALEDVERAMALPESNCRLRNSAGGIPLPPEILAAVRNSQAATCVALAERWLLDHPDDLWVTHEYAEMLYLLTRYDEAIAVYHAALERFKDNRWGIFNQVGRLYTYRGNLREAEQWYRKATEEEPSEARSFIFLGDTQARQGNLAVAEETLRRATQCTVGFLDEAHCSLGHVLRGQGRLSEAAECFRRAIEISPEYKDAIVALEDVTQAIPNVGRS